MNDKTKWENAHFEHDANPVDGSMSKPAAAQEAVAPERVAWASTGATGHKVVAMPGLHKLPYGDYDLFASPVAAAPVEMSPEFTDTARAAIAWVLWHHQGGSSPIGQPLRFALGMGDHDPLPEWRIAEAKRYAEWAGATTAKFHEARASTPAAPEAGYIEFLDAQNHSLRRAIHAIMKKLAFLLDEDQFAEIDSIALAAGSAPVAAAPEVPAARVTEPLRADESRQEQADSAIYNRGWNDCRAAMLAARRPAGQQPVAYQSRHALGPLGGDGWGLWTDTGRAEFERLSSLIEGNPDHFSQLVEVRALAVAL